MCHQTANSTESHWQPAADPQQRHVGVTCTILLFMFYHCQLKILEIHTKSRFLSLETGESGHTSQCSCLEHLSRAEQKLPLEGTYPQFVNSPCSPASLIYV